MIPGHFTTGKRIHFAGPLKIDNEVGSNDDAAPDSQTPLVRIKKIFAERMVLKSPGCCKLNQGGIDIDMAPGDFRRQRDTVKDIPAIENKRNSCLFIKIGAVDNIFASAPGMVAGNHYQRQFQCFLDPVGEIFGYSDPHTNNARAR